MKLTDADILNISQGITNIFYSNNLEATRQLTVLFDAIARSPLNSPEDYIKMYNNNFYTYQAWEYLIESEIDQGDGLTEQECYEELGRSIWQLPCGWYIQYV